MFKTKGMEKVDLRAVLDVFVSYEEAKAEVNKLVSSTRKKCKKLRHARAISSVLYHMENHLRVPQVKMPRYIRWIKPFVL
jgi:hypothetical protein